MNSPDPVPTPPTQPPTLPVTQSPVALALIVALISQVANVLETFGIKIPFTQEQVSALVAGLLAIGGSVMALWALWKRWRSPVQPLAFTQAGADAKAAAMQNKQAGRASVGAVLLLLLVVVPTMPMLLASCASLGMVAPQSTQQRIALALAQNTGLRNTSTYALQQGIIKASEGESIKAVNDQARVLLDLADTALSSDPAGATRNVDLAIALMRELQRRLEAKGTTP